MKVLVTGGAGFIGSWVVETLLERGDEVIVLDDFSSGDRRNLKHLLGRAELSIVEGDIRDKGSVDQAAGDADATVHLAAVVSVEEATENPEYACSVNIGGTLNLLEAARWNRHRRFIYASSVAVYGEPKMLPIREDFPLRPISVYGASKLAGEGLMHAYAATYGLSALALRFFNVYGPRQKTGSYSGVIERFIEDANDGKPLVIEGDGRQTRDFVFVEDVAEAVAVALNRGATGVLNVGTGRATSVLELAKAFLRLRGDLHTKKSRGRAGDIRFSQASTAATAKALGWRAHTSLQEGLEKTLDYARSVK
jgi:UDP-glucose 4-epimerase